MQMSYKEEDLKSEMDRIIASLERMQQFAGPPNEFWPVFLEGSAGVAGAGFGLLMVRAEAP